MDQIGLACVARSNRFALFYSPIRPLVQRDSKSRAHGPFFCNSIRIASEQLVLRFDVIRREFVPVRVTDRWRVCR
jgi:hypothetical protein